MNTTTDYTGRQVDIELLQTILRPANLVEVSVSNVSKTPKMVTGIQKLVQRYAMLLLTNLNQVHFAQDQGGDILRLLLEGYVQDKGQLQYAFAFANNLVMSMLNDDDLNDTQYGTAPDDERIREATLLDSSVDKGTATAYFRIQITSQAGDDFTFVIPVTKT